MFFASQDFRSFSVDFTFDRCMLAINKTTVRNSSAASCLSLSLSPLSSSNTSSHVSLLTAFSYEKSNHTGPAQVHVCSALILSRFYNSGFSPRSGGIQEGSWWEKYFWRPRPYFDKSWNSTRPSCFPFTSTLSDGLQSETVVHCAELPGGPSGGEGGIPPKQRLTPGILSGPLGIVLPLDETMPTGGGLIFFFFFFDYEHACRPR